MSQYHKQIRAENVDIYDILKAFNVNCPATQHAIKKLLMPGQRGYKSKLSDLKEAGQSIVRAIELQKEDQKEENINRMLDGNSRLEMGN